MPYFGRLRGDGERETTDAKLEEKGEADFTSPADCFRSVKLLRSQAEAGTAVCAGSPVTATTSS